MRTSQGDDSAIANEPEAATRCGFTLIELVVALSIVSISMLAVIPLLLNTMSVNSSIKMSIKARDFAAMQVEELISQPRTVFNSAPYNLSVANSSYTSPVKYITLKGIVKDAEDQETVFRRTFRIDQVPGLTVEPRPVVITSVVQYSYKGQTQSRSFSTMWSF